MFHTAGFLDIVLRSVSVYIFILVAIRITGKKQLSQLNTFDIVLILLISNSVQNAMVGPDTSLLGGIIAASVLFLMNFIFKKLLFKSPRFKALINEKPEILIHNGKLDFNKLSNLDISDDELSEAMREHGVEKFKDVKLAMLEADGNISIISGSDHLKMTHFKRKKPHKTMGFFN
nr:YetF domain-containing protein [uncultured Pedobacter sp.]